MGPGGLAARGSAPSVGRRGAAPPPAPPPASGRAGALCGAPRAARSRLVRSRAALGAPFMLGSGNAATQRSQGAAAASAWAACEASGARRLGGRRRRGRRGAAMAGGGARPGAAGE